MRYHLVGVSGSGMSALAKLLILSGETVSGSDPIKNGAIEELISLGLKYFNLHSELNLDKETVLIYSTAIPKDNIEIIAASNLGISQLHRSEMLSAFLKGRESVIVGGTHGKTTTASMLAYVLRTAGLDPSFYIGAEIPILATSGHIGKGSFFVAEADESDGSIVNLGAEHGILLNLDPEHLDFYKTHEELVNLMKQKYQSLSGKVFLGIDDVILKRFKCEFKNAITFGFDESADYCVKSFTQSASGSLFELYHKNKKIGDFELALPGQHYVIDAAAVIAFASEWGVDAGFIYDGLKSYRSAKRRFEVIRRLNDVIFIDDYAHHPTEIKATFSAVKALNPGRVIGIFQPHRFTRIRNLFDTFVSSFSDADIIYITDIYAAGEAPIDGISGMTLTQAIKEKTKKEVFYCKSFNVLESLVLATIKSGDCIISLGAGDINKALKKIAKNYSDYIEISSVIQSSSTLRVCEPLSKHTTLKVGGPADLWFEPGSESELIAVLKKSKENSIPITLIGKGSNLLVLEGGIRGICIHLGQQSFKRLEIGETEILAGAGIRLKDLATQCRMRGIKGMEFMEGIPGNLGGSIRMNAGAMGSWIFEKVKTVTYLNNECMIQSIDSRDIIINYRDVPFFNDKIVLSVVLNLELGDKLEINNRAKAFSNKRWETQPAAPSAGCIFKNPIDMAAGKLIENLGLKNLKVGGAKVSEIHGNFIVNEGGATASDVLELIKIVKDRAFKERGICLELEVIIMGEDL